jgi:hypothetical protein
VNVPLISKFQVSISNKVVANFDRRVLETITCCIVEVKSLFGATKSQCL